MVQLPPMFRVWNVVAPSTWHSPAVPVTCFAASSSIRAPVAPTGWPVPIRPPLGLTGSLPSIAMSPASIAFQDSPGAVSPKWSIAMYSVVVKQSWVSMPSSASGPAIPARVHAAVIASRTCGRT